MEEADVFHASISPDPPGPGRAQGSLILVVEDDADLRIAVRDVLETEGFSIVEAPHGSAALDYLLGTPKIPSLILLDLKMPIMSGRAMIRVLQGYVRLSTIPVLLVTSELLLTDAPEEGTVGRLQKPFSARDLLALVRRYAAPV